MSISNKKMSISNKTDIIMKHYSNLNKDLWDDFVINKSRNGTIFHERNFLEYHPEDRFKDTSLIFYKNNTNPLIIEAVFPSVLLKKNNISILSSHPGSSYGGLIFSLSTNTKQLYDIIELIIEHARELNADKIEIKLPEQIIFSDPPDQEFSFLLWHRGFKLKTRELSSAIFLQSEIPLSKLSKKTYSWSLNKAKENNIKISYDIPVEKVYPLIEANLKNRFEKLPTHSFSELIDLKKRYNKRIKLWTALKDNIPIAVVVIFEANKIAVHDFYISQNYEFSKMQPLYLIFDSIFNYYKNQSFKWFNFGISTRENWIKWGILNFKEGLGGRGLIRETWILDDINFPKPDDSNII